MDKVIVRNLTKTYGKNKVLNNVNVSFEAGKIHGLVGRNGSGKTQLMKCICNFVRPDQGEVEIDGVIVGKDEMATDDMGIIIENPGFLPQYSALKNLELLAMINNKVKKSELIAVLEMVGLDPKNRKRVGKFSMGMRQRLGIAQAIMEKPSLLLLDEPFNGLDNSGVCEMRQVFMKLRDEGKTLIVASHNHEDIDILCDTVCEMDNGILNCTERKK